MKKCVLLLFTITLLSFTLADEVLREVDNAIISGTENIPEIAQDITSNADSYVEIIGQNLLKFQEFFMGALNFFSVGMLGKSEGIAFEVFLLFSLLFMAVYGVSSSIFKKHNFGIAFCITFLAIIGIDLELFEYIFTAYQSMGVVVTIVLPILILLAFTFRTYQRAYEGRTQTSPFYAEMFNLVFLIFFGVFFIRHSATEEGVIASMRLISGWALIVLGIAQTVFYKILATAFHRWKNQEMKEKITMKKIKEKTRDKILDAQSGLDKP